MTKNKIYKSGNKLRLHTNKVAENRLELMTQNSTGCRRGPKVAIENGRLWNARDHLVWLLEVTWDELGVKLSKIKTAADVYDVLQVWKQDNRQNQHPITQTLLRSSSSPATGKLLKERRRRLETLNKSIGEAYEYQEKCRASLVVAERAFTSQLSEGEKAVVEEQRTRRANNLAHAEAEYLAATKRREHMEELLKDGEAYFARAEFVRFCRSERYTLTPLNLANALAGLPYLGWRQSAKRCKKKVCPGVNGGTMQAFNTIRRIVQSCPRRSELIRHAERWLRTCGDTKSYGPSELRKDWYFLRWSIKTVLEVSPRILTRDLPYAIAKEYRQRKEHPSNVDKLFEEEERIV